MLFVMLGVKWRVLFPIYFAQAGVNVLNGAVANDFRDHVFSEWNEKAPDGYDLGEYKFWTIINKTK